MSESALLDYAGECFAWHPDWPEERPSTWHLLPDLDAIRSRWRKKMALPREAKPETHVNYCGGCFARFVSPTAQESADALRLHIEQTPCAHYAA
jgi:hypothetical protein